MTGNDISNTGVWTHARDDTEVTWFPRVLHVPAHLTLNKFQEVVMLFFSTLDVRGLPMELTVMLNLMTKLTFTDLFVRELIDKNFTLSVKVYIISCTGPRLIWTYNILRYSFSKMDAFALYCSIID